MLEGDRLLLAVALGVLLFMGLLVVLAVRSFRARGRAFHDIVRSRGLLLCRDPGPWTGPVARGTLGAFPLAIGPVTHGESGFVRFGVVLPRPLPAGTYVHGQSFRYNTGGARLPGMPAYDGAQDDPSTLALFAHVPELVLGDEALDRAFVIQATDPDAVRRLLTSPDVRMSLLSGAASGAHVRLRDARVELDVADDALGSPEAYERRLAELTALAEAIARFIDGHPFRR